MRTLDDAWAWYRAVAEGAKRLVHLAKFWDAMPDEEAHEWIRNLARDSVLKGATAEKMSGQAIRVTDELDDLAILLLFSVFEANIRDLVESQVQPEIARLQHRALKNAAEELLKSIREGSFGFLLERLKETQANDLIEQVSQVRRYRNWVAHGCRDDMRPNDLVKPQQAYERLTAFLNRVRGSVPSAIAAPPQDPP
jgi:hypothetical protein